MLGWVEANIRETLTFYGLPRAQHKPLKSTRTLERLNDEIKRRTLVVRIFPNRESCLRLIRALCVVTDEIRLEDKRYLNMTFPPEQKKALLRLAAGSGCALSALLRATPCATPAAYTTARAPTPPR